MTNTFEENNNCCNGNHDHEHNCCGEHHDEAITITLTMDDDSELECSVIGTFEVEGKDYIALLPESDDYGEDIFLYAYRELGTEEIELDIIEEEIFDQVAEEFDKIFNEEEEV